ncbi:amidohydrolase [Gracilibacillus alcaliphilus]|uniref:amidohydrolase n=1 Tax=Gracilibacillus alcaliphilus TaxID=1401441 RepID=UPI001956BD9A|nr:amidohydrolase [Gracilibacillus alcaliphilus]MBM7676268.1 cytosine deaminase [Gracilibacillus alcaliphilus]
MTDRPYWLTNVRLEKGYQYHDGEIMATETDLYHVLIQESQIQKVVPAAQVLDSALSRQEAKGLLMLPAFRDMHIHLDKTYYGGRWKAPSIAKEGILTRLKEEEALLPALHAVTEERAMKLMDLLLSAGSTYIRSHCNVGPVEGLRNLESTLRAVETYKDKIAVEIVAFPQQGLLRSNAASYVREALRNGAGLVGGVDPGSIDQDIEKSLQLVMELAVEADAAVDLHIHEPGQLGMFTFKRLAALTEEAGWQGRVTISHAFALADASLQEAEEAAELLAAQSISLTSTVPLSRTIPVPMLKAKGVDVWLGDDSITDHWSPFGRGDSLEKAGRLAERFGMSDERSLGQALAHITGGITPLDEQGQQIWPRVGDEASFVLVEASCSAEAVARRASRKAVFFKGKQIVKQ